MAKIVLISCAATQYSGFHLAECLYQKSRLFAHSLEYAKLLCPDAIYVLSTKHHLLALGDVVEKYDVTFSSMSTADKKKWGQVVLSQLGGVSNLSSDEYIILAGQSFYRKLRKSLPHCTIPMEHIARGNRISWLETKIQSLAKTKTGVSHV